MVLQDRDSLKIGGAKTEFDPHRIGGATLRDHSHNVAMRANGLARHVERLSHTIHDGLFGASPRDADATGEPPRQLTDNVAGDLTDTDAALNVLSNAIMLLEEVGQKMGLGQGATPEKDPFDPETQTTPALTRRGGSARSPERYG